MEGEGSTLMTPSSIFMRQSSLVIRQAQMDTVAISASLQTLELSPSTIPAPLPTPQQLQCKVSRVMVAISDNQLQHILSRPAFLTHQTSRRFSGHCWHHQWYDQRYFLFLLWLLFCSMYRNQHHRKNRANRTRILLRQWWGHWWHDW